MPVGGEPGDVQALAEALLGSGASPQQLVTALLAAVGPARVDHFLGEQPLRVPAPPRRVSVYRVRVDLVGAKPPIWRRLELAGDLTLDVVHSVLQDAMGWWDGHLHAFRPIGEHQHFLTAFDLEEGDEGLAEHEVRLDQVLRKVGGRLRYEYDFGDGWEHLIKVEAVRLRTDGDAAARCLGGRCACPPEDIGGIYRYNELAAAMRGVLDGSPRELELIEWLPAGFDPDEFDPEATDHAVQQVVAPEPDSADGPALS